MPALPAASSGTRLCQARFRERTAITSASPQVEIRVCCNRTCKRQGSQEVLKFLQDLDLDGTEVNSSSCLAGCGHGPNMAILAPGQQPVVVSHVATISDAAEAVRSVCGLPVDDAVIAATQARLSGNALARGGDLEAALSRYTQGLDASPAVGSHLLLCNRSAVLLQLGRKEEALRDALAALHAAPQGFANAWIRVVDSFYALGRYEEAADATMRAIKENPQFKRMNEFKAARQALQGAGQHVVF